MKSVHKCYWTNCKQKVEYEWHPNKRPGFLYVCKEHYDLLINVFNVSTIGKNDDLIVVEVVLEVQ
jgi:hypothetical protein